MKTIKIFITSFYILCISCAYSQWSGTTQVYLNIGQSAGIGTSSPQAPLHIIGDGQANAQGWNKSIILDKNAALYWKGSQNSYFRYQQKLFQSFKTLEKLNSSFFIFQILSPH